MFLAQGPLPPPPPTNIPFNSITSLSSLTIPCNGTVLVPPIFMLSQQCNKPCIIRSWHQWEPERLNCIIQLRWARRKKAEKHIIFTWSSSKSPWRSGSRQACRGILRGEDIEKKNGKEKCQRDEAERGGNETKREGEQGYKIDKCTGMITSGENWCWQQQSCLLVLCDRHVESNIWIHCEGKERHNHGGRGLNNITRGGRFIYTMSRCLWRSLLTVDSDTLVLKPWWFLSFNIWYSCNNTMDWMYYGGKQHSHMRSIAH